MMMILLILVTILRFLNVTSSSNQMIQYGYSIRGDEYGSKYPHTLQNFLSSLSSQASNTGYHNITNFSQMPNKELHGLYLCRGDVDPQTCRDCVNLAKQFIMKSYPYGKEASVWYDHCMIRYSNQSFFGKLDFTMWTASSNLSKITGDRVQFNRVLRATTWGLAVQAANALPGKKFATKVVKFSSNETLYTMAQCTPDLTPRDCFWCLTKANVKLRRMGSTTGGRVTYLNCMARYEIFPFFWDSKIKSQSPSYLEAANSTVASVRVQVDPLPPAHSSTRVRLRVRVEPITSDNSTVDSSAKANTPVFRLKAWVDTSPIHNYTIKSKLMNFPSKVVTNATVIKQNESEVDAKGSE